MQNIIIRNTILILLLLFTVQYLWANGQEEAIDPPAPDEPNQLLSKYRISNSGVIYEFYETKPLPTGASYGILNLYNINSKRPPINEQIQFTEDMETFKYSITHPYNSFYPLLPFVATLTIIDEEGTPLRTSEAKFNSFFSFYQADTIDASSEISDPILFSTENKIIGDEGNYSSLYNLSDEKISELLEYQIKLSIEYFQGEEKHLLLSGIAFTDEKSKAPYDRISEKTQLVKTILDALKDSYDSLTVESILYSKDSMEYADNLYPNNDQAIIRISDSIHDINIYKDAHIALNIAHTKTINHSLYDEYFALKSKVVNSVHNTNTVLSEHEIMQVLLDQNNIANYISETTQLDDKMYSYIIDTDTIISTLQDIEKQFALLYSGYAVSSLSSILETINASGLNDLPIFNKLLSLRLRDTEQNINFSKIITEYKRRKDIITTYKLMNKELLDTLVSIKENFSTQADYFDTEFNVTELETFRKSLIDLNTSFSELNTLKYDYVNASEPVLQKLLENLSSAIAKIESLETEIISISEVVNTYSFNTSDNTKLALLPNPENRLENIGLGVNNIYEISKGLVYQNASITTLEMLHKDKDSAYQQYKDIFATVSPILHINDIEIMTMILSDSIDVSNTDDIPPTSEEALEKKVKPQANAPDSSATSSNATNGIPFNTRSNTPASNTTNSNITLKKLPNATKITTPLNPNTSSAGGFHNNGESTDNSSIDITYDQLNNLYQNNKNSSPKSTQNFIPSADQESEMSIAQDTNTVPQKNSYTNTPLAHALYNNSSSYTILGSASTNPNQVYNYISTKIRIPPKLDITNILYIYFEEAAREHIKPEIAIAQMLYVTDMLQNKTVLAKYNPSGLGGPSTKKWQLYPFPNFRTGIRAHIQHLKAYASNEPFSTDIVDPRYNILQANKMIGSASTAEKVIQSWYNNSEAKEKIFAILSEMNNY